MIMTKVYPSRLRGLALACLLAAAPLAPSTATEWARVQPEEVGFATDLTKVLNDVLSGEQFEGLHSVVLVRQGKLVYEKYLRGDDEKFGVLKEDVSFTPESLHDIRSITKSVIGLLYGIALKRNEAPTLATPIFRAYPDYPELPRHPTWREITIAHALSMTMGQKWDETTLPYNEPANSERAMYRAADSIRYALHRPMSAQPGSTWNYSGGATAILAEVIRRGTGKDLLEFARAELFDPLGIEAFEWITDYNGLPHAAAGLRLRPRDTAKLGQLVLQSGMWEGEEVVPKEWIALSAQPHAEASDGCHYGYHWWLCKTASGIEVVEGAGWGGQNLLIVPELDVVLVTNAGLYGDYDAWTLAYALLEDYIAPALGEQ